MGCGSDSSSHGTRSVLLFCGPAHIDSLWPVLTRVKSGQARFDEGQNGPGSQVGLEHLFCAISGSVHRPLLMISYYLHSTLLSSLF